MQYFIVRATIEYNNNILLLLILSCIQGVYRVYRGDRLRIRRRPIAAQRVSSYIE